MAGAFVRSLRDQSLAANIANQISAALANLPVPVVTSQVDLDELTFILEPMAADLNRMRVGMVMAETAADVD